MITWHILSGKEHGILKINGVNAKPIKNGIPILIKKCFQISKLLLNSIEKKNNPYKRSILINILQIIYFSNHFCFENDNNNKNNNSNFLSIPKFQKLIELSKQKQKEIMKIEELKLSIFEIIFD